MPLKAAPGGQLRLPARRPSPHGNAFAHGYTAQRLLDEQVRSAIKAEIGQIHAGFERMAVWHGRLLMSGGHASIKGMPHC